MQRQYPDKNSLSPPTSRISVAMLGGTFASVVWALAWVTVAVVALHRETRFFTASATLGVVVSLVVSAGGCLVAWNALKSAHRCPDPPVVPQSVGRQIVGVFAMLFWSCAGAAWNFGVFGWLFSAAAEGRGVTLTVMVLWSLIGWVLLHILCISLGSAVDSVVGYRH